MRYCDACGGTAGQSKTIGGGAYPKDTGRTVYFCSDKCEDDIDMHLASQQATAQTRQSGRTPRYR